MIQMQEEVFADCKEADERQWSLLEKLREDLATRVKDWGARRDSAKLEASAKVAEVHALAEKLRWGLLEDLWATRAHVDAEAGKLECRVEQHRGLVREQLGGQRQRTKAVREHAEQRVDFAQHLAEQQATEKTSLAQESLNQVTDLLDGTRRIAKGRAQEASEHLMGFLDDGEANRVWRALSPEDTRFVVTPSSLLKICGSL